MSVLLGNGAGAFQAAPTIQVAARPRAVIAADLDGDGKRDPVTANYAAGNVAVLLGNGDGTFRTAVLYAAGMGTFSVAVGDFNKDGRPDLVAANSANFSFSLFLGERRRGGSSPRGTSSRTRG